MDRSASSSPVLFGSLALYLACAPSAVLGHATPPALLAASDCGLADADRALVNEALEGWRREAAQVLGEADPDVPWIVLVGAECVWHLAPPQAAAPGLETVDFRISFRGQEVPTRAGAHGGLVRLPGDREVEVQPLSSTSLAEDETPYVLLSLPGVWREHPAFAEAPREAVEEFWLGVFLHEVVHTRQLPWVSGRLEALQDEGRLPEDLNDNVVQTRFGDIPEFEAAVREELTLLHRAVTAENGTDARVLIRRALGVAEDRRKRYFVGEDAAFAEAEELFLALEGAAVWAAFRVINEDRLERTRSGELLADYDPFARDWVQAYGLLAYALIDRFVPGWAERSFGRPPESPFVLLRDAAAGSSQNGRSSSAPESPGAAKGSSSGSSGPPSG